METVRKKVNETKQEETEEGGCTRCYKVIHKGIAKEMEGMENEA